MLAIKGLSLFLVKGSYISYHSLNYVLADYLEEYKYLIFLRDFIEIDIIKTNPRHLTKSYLFPEIEPFLLPYYEKTKQLNSTSL